MTRVRDPYRVFRAVFRAENIAFHDSGPSLVCYLMVEEFRYHYADCRMQKSRKQGSSDLQHWLLATGSAHPEPDPTTNVVHLDLDLNTTSSVIGYLLHAVIHPPEYVSSPHAVPGPLQEPDMHAWWLKTLAPCPGLSSLSSRRAHCCTQVLVVAA